MVTGRRGFGICASLYVLTILTMATVGVFVPFMAVLSSQFSASGGQIGFAIALFSLPSALFAAIGGGIMDAVGLRRSLICGGVLAVVGDGIAQAALSLPFLYLALLFCGLGFAGISVAVPAYLVATMEGGARTRAISFWSTYAPTGFALGLLLAVPFADGGNWRMAISVHAALIAMATAAMLFLPKVAAAGGGAGLGVRLREFGLVFGNVRILRLGVAVALPNAISYGTSIVAPSYLARVHDVGIAASSTTVAVAKIVAMMIGGIVTGHLLARRMNMKLFFAGLALVGVIAQILLYSPASSFGLATGALILWLFAFGGMAGCAMAQLPMVVSNPARGAAASGLLGQFISIASFAAPATYFAVVGWGGYILLAALGLGISAVILPGGPKAA